MQGSIYLHSFQEEEFLRKRVLFETDCFLINKRKHIFTLDCDRNPTNDHQCFLATATKTAATSAGKGSLAVRHACVNCIQNEVGSDLDQI